VNQSTADQLGSTASSVSSATAVATPYLACRLDVDARATSSHPLPKITSMSADGVLPPVLDLNHTPGPVGEESSLVARLHGPRPTSRLESTWSAKCQP
jgi:hypothetical protein